MKMGSDIVFVFHLDSPMTPTAFGGVLSSGRPKTVLFLSCSSTFLSKPTKQDVPKKIDPWRLREHLQTNQELTKTSSHTEGGGPQTSLGKAVIPFLEVGLAGGSREE